MIQIRQINDKITIGILDMTAFAATSGTVLKRDNEKGGTKRLLQELLKTESYQLMYTPFNKPYLHGREEHISISHSHNKLAIIVNRKENTGIDIELIRDKVKNIQHKFVSDAEMPFVRDHAEKLITVWAAKEAMYKVYGEKELEFRKHLFVEQFDSDKIIGGISIGNFKKTFMLAAETIDNYKMVYVLNEI